MELNQDQKNPSNDAGANNMQTTDDARKKSSVAIWGSVVVVLILVLLLFSFLVTDDNSDESFVEGLGVRLFGTQSEEGGLADKEQLNTILDKTRSGDYEGAVETYNQVLASSPNPGELAYAVRTSATPRYKATGDIEDYLSSVREMKLIVSDKSVSLRSRIKTLNKLASSYSQMGEDPRVYQETYSGEVFSQFVVPGDPIATTRNLYEWGYAAYPTAKAGIAIAALYVRDVANNPDMDAKTREDYIAQTKKYVAQSDALVNREEQLQDPESNVLAGYKTWRAFTVGTLSYLGEESDASQYKKDYKSLESDFSKISNVEALQYKPFGHWMYSTFLLLNGESEEAIESEINKAVDFFNNDSNKATNEFAEYMRNWKDKREFADDDFLTGEVVTLMSVSPEFSEFIENI